MATMEQKMRVIVDAENKTGSALRGVSKELDKVQDRTEKLNDAFGKMALAGTAATAALGYGMGQALKASSRLAESTNAVNVVFDDAAAAIHRFGKESAKAAGLSEASFNEAAANIGALLINLGFSAEEAAAQTQKLTVRAADMASVMNTSVEQALGAISSGLKGSSEPLDAFAVNLLDTAVSAHAVEAGLDGAGGEMTEQQKTIARLSLLYKQTEQFAGDFANTSDSLANSLKIAGASAENTAATLGQALAPIATKIANALIPIVTAIGKWVEQNPKLAAGIAILVTSLAALTAVVGLLGMAFIAFTAVSWPIVGIVALIVGGLALLIAAGVALYKNWDKITAFAGSAWENIKDVITGALQAIKDFFVSIWNGIKTFFKTYIYILVGLFALMMDLIFPEWEAGLQALLVGWQKIWNGIKAYFSNVWGGLKIVFETMAGFFKGIWEGVVSVFDWAKEKIGEALDWISDKVEPIFDILDRVKDTLRDIGQGISNAFDSVVERGRDVLGGRAIGGPVISGGSYLVGERGPEVFTPSTAGRISQPGGAGLVIQFNGNTFVGREGIADQIMQDIVRELQLRMKVTL